MYPTATVAHLASVSAADELDDMRIYEFDRDASEVLIGGNGWSGWTNTMPGTPFVKYDEVLAA